MPDLRLLVFGGCNIRAPLRRALQRRRPDSKVNWDDARTDFKIAGPPFFTYTFGEMLQAIACYRGDRRIPSELHALCNKSPRGSPTPANSPIEASDIALAEPNTSNEIVFDGYHLNRSPVWNLLTPLRRLGPSARRLCSQWYDKGVVGMDEEARRAAAEALVALIPEHVPDRELTSAIIGGARGGRRDPRRGMDCLAKALDTPLGIVTFTWAYMADGRPVSWPAEFHGQILGAALELGLPVFEPHRLVRQTGVAVALGADLRHYREAFMPVIAKPLIEFAHSVASDGRRAAAARS